jgi:hypothetical protein
MDRTLGGYLKSRPGAHLAHTRLFMIAEGGYTMHLRRRLPLIVALGVCLSLAPTVLTVSGTTRYPLGATFGLSEDTPTTSSVRELESDSATVKVRAMVPHNLKVSDPVQGTVRATVMAINGQINQVKIYTHEGQMFLLFMEPQSLARMRVGEQFTLQVAQRLAP